jgi:hypothetical protein
MRLSDHQYTQRLSTSCGGMTAEEYIVDHVALTLLGMVATAPLAFWDSRPSSALGALHSLIYPFRLPAIEHSEF